MGFYNSETPDRGKDYALPGLISLAIGTFSLGIAEFGMMGILGEVAQGVNVSIVEAGHLISAYSSGVAAGAPMLIFLRRISLKKIMLLLAAVITFGNTFAALSTGYGMLLAARFIAGLPHGAFFGAGAIVCSHLARPGHGAAAVAVMIGGMTVANVVGVPVVTYLCSLFSWRMAFGVIAVFGVLTVIGIYAWVPRIGSLPDSGIKGQFRFLKSSAPWLIYAAVFFGQASVYCWLSYIEPVMTKITGFPSGDMTWIMMFAGIGMVAGNAVAGKLSDRYGAARVCGMLTSMMVVVMPMLYFFAELKTLSLILMFIACASLFGIGGPLQYLIVRFSRGGEMLGGAGIQIAFNVSNAMSAAIGGAVINLGFGLASPALVGVPFAITGTTALFFLRKKYSTQGV